MVRSRLNEFLRDMRGTVGPMARGGAMAESGCVQCTGSIQRWRRGPMLLPEAYVQFMLSTYNQSLGMPYDDPAHIVSQGIHGAASRRSNHHQSGRGDFGRRAVRFRRNGSTGLDLVQARIAVVLRA